MIERITYNLRAFVASGDERCKLRRDDAIEILAYLDGEPARVAAAVQEATDRQHRHWLWKFGALAREVNAVIEGIAPVPRPGADAVTTAAPAPSAGARVCGYFIDCAGGGIGYTCERTEPCGEFGEYGCPLRKAAATPAPAPVVCGGWVHGVERCRRIEPCDLAGCVLRAVTPPRAPDEAEDWDTVPDAVWDAARDFGMRDHEHSHACCSIDSFHKAGDAFVRAVRAYGDARDRGAVAVPAVVRGQLRERVVTLRAFARICPDDEMSARASKTADALDAWLAATAPAPTTEGTRDA